MVLFRTCTATISSRPRVPLRLYARRDNYNDDAFGLVFLGSVFIAKDTKFAATFGLFSVLAVLLTKATSKSSSLLPACVATASFLTATTFFESHEYDGDEASRVEFLLCAISCVWSLIRVLKKNKET